MKKLLPLFLVLILTLQFSAADPVSSVTTPTPFRGGDVPTATDWNDQVVGIYTWVNNNIVTALNTLTTKGDLYGYTGSVLARIPVGANGTIFRCDSGQSAGVGFASYSGEQPLTTKGDIGVFGTAITRLGVGSNGYVLGADSASSTGLGWINTANLLGFPKGSIITWSPSVAGTSTIPTGWVLCDGTNSTPNLIGMFVIGTRPNGSSATPASGGYGAYTCDAAGGGAKSHAHTVTWNNGNTITSGSGEPAGNSVFAGVNSTVLGNVHSHTFTPSPSASASTTLEPADYALVYIMKTN